MYTQSNYANWSVANPQGAPVFAFKPREAQETTVQDQFDQIEAERVADGQGMHPVIHHATEDVSLLHKVLQALKIPSVRADR